MILGRDPLTELGPNKNMNTSLKEVMCRLKGVHHSRLLFSWPPARSVWPNYDVVLFRPCSGNNPSLC